MCFFVIVVDFINISGEKKQAKKEGNNSNKNE